MALVALLTNELLQTLRYGFQTYHHGTEPFILYLFSHICLGVCGLLVMMVCLEDMWPSWLGTGKESSIQHLCIVCGCAELCFVTGLGLWVYATVKVTRRLSARKVYFSSTDEDFYRLRTWWWLVGRL